MGVVKERMVRVCDEICKTVVKGRREPVLCGLIKERVVDCMMDFV